MKKTAILALLFLAAVQARAASTTNYVVKFSSKNQVGNSLIQDDGTGVSISTPPISGVKLAVNGAVKSLSGGFVFPDGSTQTAAAVGSLTGSGSAGQVGYWSGATALTGTNFLFWDAANYNLNIGTQTAASSVAPQLTLFEQASGASGKILYTSGQIVFSQGANALGTLTSSLANFPAKVRTGGAAASYALNVGQINASNGSNTTQTNLGYNTTANQGWVQAWNASAAAPFVIQPNGGGVSLGASAAPSTALDVTGGMALLTGTLSMASGTSITSPVGIDLNLATTASGSDVLTGSIILKPGLNGAGVGTTGSVTITGAHVVGVGTIQGSSVTIQGGGVNIPATTTGGSINIFSGAGRDANSGDINLVTGNVANASGISGNIRLDVGTGISSHGSAIFRVNGSTEAVVDTNGLTVTDGKQFLPPRAAAIRGTLTPAREGAMVWDSVAHAVCTATGTTTTSWIAGDTGTTPCAH